MNGFPADVLGRIVLNKYSNVWGTLEVYTGFWLLTGGKETTWKTQA